MTPTPERVLLLFVDGVGIGAADAWTNPFCSAEMPHLRRLLAGELPVAIPSGSVVEREGAAVLIATDATLGVAGRPQSGTGQTALLTGLNAPALFGRHFGSWVPMDLRPMLRRENLLSRAREAGCSAAFANAYPVELAPRLLERRPPAFPIAAAAAGVLTRGTAALRDQQAVSSSLTNDGWQARLGSDAIPSVTPHEAGGVLGRITAEHRLTVFAHYDPDLVGHQRDLAAGVSVLERFDRFLGGVVEALPDGSLLVIASDHGNVEDCRVAHTRNPVPTIAVGPGQALFAERVRAITDIAPTLLSLLGSG